MKKKKALNLPNALSLLRVILVPAFMAAVIYTNVPTSTWLETFLYRAIPALVFGLTAITDLLDGMIEWPDNADKSKWYYLTIQEATNSHDYARRETGYEYWIGLKENPDWTAWEK